MLGLRFAAGTLELHGFPEGEALPAACRWDPRSACHRAPALAYADIVLELRRRQIAYDDQARAYSTLEPKLALARDPRPFQTEALEAFRRSSGRGVIVLPTGAGKSHVGVMAIDDRRRSALVVVPTLDLVRQWYDLLRTSFATEVGIVGGGSHDVRPLTVTTYDSAYLHMQHFGARFGLVIFDECHHLPGATYELSAELCLAPFRLGLTATPERPDGREALLTRLVGPVVYRRDIIELAGEYLSEYETLRVAIELSPEERVEYDEQRKIYLDFVRSQGIRFSSPTGWNDFLMRASRTPAGLTALAAYRRQRELALAASQKLDNVGF
jgi:superfamily II DNA or RNA helicase